MDPQRAARDENEPVGRLQRKRRRRTDEIATTAATLFGERGYDAVSLEDVADRLDVTKGSLYYYFASKDELATAAIETLGAAWTLRLEELSATLVGTAGERLRALVAEHLSIAVREYPAGLRLFLVPEDWPAEQQARVKALRRRHDRVFRAILEDGVAAGELRVVSLDRTLQCMHAAMSQAPVWCRGLRGRAVDRAIDEITDTVMLLAGRSPVEPG